MDTFVEMIWGTTMFWHTGAFSCIVLSSHSILFAAYIDALV